MTALTDIFADYELLEADDRYRLLIDFGRDFEPMPAALQTAATPVRGCSAAVWLYPNEREDGTLHFLADSYAAITTGILTLIFLSVQARCATPTLEPAIQATLA